MSSALDQHMFLNLGRMSHAPPTLWEVADEAAEGDFMVALERSLTPLTSTVALDEITQAVVDPFDFATDGLSSFYPFQMPPLPATFGLGVIVGASGTGKSTLLKEIANPASPHWGNGSIASHFDSAEDAITRLSAAGLMSVPDWVKPYGALSNGQAFRANLARSLHDGAVIDEFTSVVDRNVAKSASAGMSRFVKSGGASGIVVATCHRDVLPFLSPDWVIDTDAGTFSSWGRVQSPTISLGIFACSNAVWGRFANHHYLSPRLNKASHSYLARWEGEVVAFNSVMTRPAGTLQHAWGEHRLVVHPDYQGLGIGPRFSEALGAYYRQHGKRYFSKTSHPRLGNYRDASPNWRATSKNHMKRNDGANLEGKLKWGIDPNRWTYSHEYIGEPAP